MWRRLVTQCYLRGNCDVESFPLTIELKAFPIIQNPSGKPFPLFKKTSLHLSISGVRAILLRVVLYFNSRLGKARIGKVGWEGPVCLTPSWSCEKWWNILQRPLKDAPERKHTAYRLFRRQFAQASFNGLRQYLNQLFPVRNQRKLRK